MINITVIGHGVLGCKRAVINIDIRIRNLIIHQWVLIWTADPFTAVAEILKPCSKTVEFHGVAHMCDPGCLK